MILNGSYNINFTMDLVVKDMSLFERGRPAIGRPLGSLAAGVGHFQGGQERYGARACRP